MPVTSLSPPPRTLVETLPEAERAARRSWRASALEFLARQPLLNGEPCLGLEPVAEL